MSARPANAALAARTGSSRRAAHARAGFTLVEIMVALAILAVAMTVLVETQGGAVLATLESERYLVATSLAEEKLAEVQFRLEREGFSQSDIEEGGDFSEYAASFGGTLNTDDMDFSEYQWAYTIREVDFALGDIQGAMGEMQEEGLVPATESSSGEGGAAGTDLSSMVPTDQLSDMLSPYVREVRVVVWWGSDDEFSEEGGCISCVEITTHMVNPSGQLNIPQDTP